MKNQSTLRAKRKPVAAALDADTQRKLDTARAEYNARKGKTAPVVEAKPAVQKSFLHHTFGVHNDYSVGEAIALIVLGKRREDTWPRIIVANMTNFCVAFGVAWLMPYLAFGLALAAMTLTTSMVIGLAIFYVTLIVGFYYAFKFGRRAFDWVRSGQADFDCAMLGVKTSVKVAQVIDWFKPKSDEEVLAAAGA